MTLYTPWISATRCKSFLQDAKQSKARQKKKIDSSLWMWWWAGLTDYNRRLFARASVTGSSFGLDEKSKATKLLPNCGHWTRRIIGQVFRSKHAAATCCCECIRHAVSPNVSKHYFGWLSLLFAQPPHVCISIMYTTNLGEFSCALWTGKSVNRFLCDILWAQESQEKLTVCMLSLKHFSCVWLVFLIKVLLQASHYLEQTKPEPRVLPAKTGCM